MKVIIKSLKQVVYEVEVPSSDVTVLELKKNIEETHKFEHDTLKLVFNGSIIEDGKKLSDYKIEEGSIIIMMSVKAKPKNTDKAQVDTKTEEKPADKKVEQPETAANYSEQLNTLTNELGFPKAESEAAIKAAKGNLIEQFNKFLHENNLEDFEVDEIALRTKSEEPIVCNPDEDLLWVHENGRLVQRCVKVRWLKDIKCWRKERKLKRGKC